MTKTPMVIRPLQGVVEPRHFIEFHAKPRHWRCSRRTLMYLPGVQFRSVKASLFEAQPELLIIERDYGWDGSSGPAADTPDAWIPSLAHDLSCTWVDGAPVLPGYFARHLLYCRLLWAQRPRPAPRRGAGRLLDGLRTVWCGVRVGLDAAGLVLGNWPLVLRERRRDAAREAGADGPHP